MTLLQIEWTKAQTIAAFITGIVSIILAIWTFISGRINQKETMKNQKEIETMKNDLAKENEKLKSELAERKSENDARRAYEFEARKKLYNEYEPLLFQLIESSTNIIYRIQNIAKACKDGNLKIGGWFSKFNYYTKSTIYKLSVPLAIYKIMQKKLTLVDLTLDKSIQIRFMLVKQLYLSFTDDFDFALILKKIDYDPNNLDWRKLREENETKYWRQGIPMGQLDKMISLLIEKDENHKDYIIDFESFEKKLDEPEKIGFRIDLVKDFFLNFHPQRRPILWRILIGQYLIIKVLQKLNNLPASSFTEDFSIVSAIGYDDYTLEEIMWSNDSNLVHEIEEPLKVAVEYLNKKIQ